MKNKLSDSDRIESLEWSVLMLAKAVVQMLDAVGQHDEDLEAIIDCYQDEVPSGDPLPS